MHYYFTKVQRRETLMDAKFSLMLAPVYNFIAYVVLMHTHI